MPCVVDDHDPGSGLAVAGGRGGAGVEAVTAAEDLYPFNRGTSADFPGFPQPYYTVNPTQAELDAKADRSSLWNHTRRSRGVSVSMLVTVR